MATLQELLDEIHASGIDQLYLISGKDRPLAVKLTKQKLRLARQHINQERDKINAGLDGRKPDE